MLFSRDSDEDVEVRKASLSAIKTRRESNKRASESKEKPKEVEEIKTCPSKSGGKTRPEKETASKSEGRGGSWWEGQKEAVWLQRESPDRPAGTPVTADKTADAATKSGPSLPSGPSAAMAELANLVNAHTRAGVMNQTELHDMRPFLRNMHSRAGPGWPTFGEESGCSANASMLSDDEESVVSSSRLTNKSDKNLADFEDEIGEDMNSLEGCDDSDDILNFHSQHGGLGGVVSMLHQQQLANFCQQQQNMRSNVNRLTARQQREGARLLAHYKLDSVCQQGNTLLWDLLQDGNIEQLSEGLASEAEKSLVTLLCFNMERFIRMKFIEGCLSNVAKNHSVAISLRLLPKLFQSFQHGFHQRGNQNGLEVHEICMFAEKRHNMMRLFFNNLEEYTEQYGGGNGEGSQPPYFNHLLQIQVRLQFPRSDLFYPGVPGRLPLD